jgi:isopenicillin N synthase-like dioxygenase
VIAKKPLRGRNRWPLDMPGLCADMMAYFIALGAICDHMVPPFVAALGVPADFFASYFAGEGRLIRAFCITRRRPRPKTTPLARGRTPTTVS